MAEPVQKTLITHTKGECILVGLSPEMVGILRDGKENAPHPVLTPSRLYAVVRLSPSVTFLCTASKQTYTRAPVRCPTQYKITVRKEASVCILSRY